MTTGAPTFLQKLWVQTFLDIVVAGSLGTLQRTKFLAALAEKQFIHPPEKSIKTENLLKSATGPRVHCKGSRCRLRCNTLLQHIAPTTDRGSAYKQTAKRRRHKDTAATVHEICGNEPTRVGIGYIVHRNDGTIGVLLPGLSGGS